MTKQPIHKGDDVAKKRISVEEVLRPVVEDFPYDFEMLKDAVISHMKALYEYGQEATLSATDEECALARQKLAAHEKIVLTVRYPHLERAFHELGDHDDKYAMPDKIRRHLLIPRSLKLIVGRATVYEFIGSTDTQTFTVSVREDGSKQLAVESHRF